MVAATGKRKKTADMPDSPPKRATRARTKAPDEIETKSKTMRTSNSSIKAATDKKKAVAPAKVAKCKTKADQEDVEMIEEPVAIEQPKQKPAKSAIGKTNKAAAPPKLSKRKTRADDEEVKVEEPVALEEAEIAVEQPQAELSKAKGRQKKSTIAAKKEPQMPDAPKTRCRQPKAIAIEDAKAAAAKPTRGRPKKGADLVLNTPELEEQIESKTVEPVKKTARGRVATTSKASISVPPKTMAAPTKKVKFQEEPDKENIPVEAALRKKSAMKTKGMQAKPVRKPAATRGSTRGRKATQEDVTAEGVSKSETTPLSPKKVYQIAKSDPISSEDELSSEKTPIRTLSKSPAKRPMSPIKDIGSVSKLNFNRQSAPSSPAKTMSATILASPARRPPSSHFKDALKTSAKKLDLGDSMVQPTLMSSRTPMKASLLQASPRKGIPDSAFKPTLASSQSPFKPSLLQSPARRPNASPKKAVIPVLERKGCSAAPIPEANAPEQTQKRVIEEDEEAKGATVMIDDSQSDRRAGPAVEDELIRASTAKSGETYEPEASEVDVIQQFPSSPRAKDSASDDTVLKAPFTFKAPAFSIASSSFRRISMESEGSEDELASPQRGYEVTPMRRIGISVQDPRTPIMMPDPRKPSSSNIPFTLLADKLSTWAASSPNKQNTANQSRQVRGVFSIGGIDGVDSVEQTLCNISAAAPTNLSFFDEEMAARDEQEYQAKPELVTDKAQHLATFEVSQESQASEEYGDENAAPTDAEMLREEQDPHDAALTCTPAKVFTLAKPFAQQPRVSHTVSKVPLRASADDSPLSVPRQRSRSFGGPLADVKPLLIAEGSEDLDMPYAQPATPVLKATAVPQTPSSSLKLDTQTPGRTVRKGVVPDVLNGAVVYVDVHTTEGADASNIFVDLLTQMGARCVKQWSWDPRTSIASPPDDSDSPQPLSPEISASKVGITHVVYKDGGKRTLEKVRASNGIVLCVGVGWVLDCEREDKWLDEDEYAIDTSLVPRGGSRRRKSMEPRALANLNGNLVPARNETPAKPTMSPTKEFLNFNTPASRRETFIYDPLLQRDLVSAQGELLAPAPATPQVALAGTNDNIMEDGSLSGSPTTPYYLSKGADLVQRTCPSKQMGGLFPVSGEIDDHPDETVRRRLIEARRKSLQWSSRIRSPLGRTVSYGK